MKREIAGGMSGEPSCSESVGFIAHAETISAAPKQIPLSPSLPKGDTRLSPPAMVLNMLKFLVRSARRMGKVRETHRHCKIKNASSSRRTENNLSPSGNFE